MGGEADLESPQIHLRLAQPRASHGALVGCAAQSVCLWFRTEHCQSMHNIVRVPVQLMHQPSEPLAWPPALVAVTYI